MGQEQGPLDAAHLGALARSGQIRADTPVRSVTGSHSVPAQQVPGGFSDKQRLATLLWSVFLGGPGVDRFCPGQIGLGILKLGTLGGCGVWSLIDIILIAAQARRHPRASVGLIPSMSCVVPE